MIFEKQDYIVKAKDIDIEIKQSIINKYKSFKYFLGIEIFAFVIAMIQLFFSKDKSINLIMFVGCILMATLVIVLENSWSIKVKDKKIYIKSNVGNHKIKYKDLVSIERCYRTIKHHSEKVLEVRYLKGRKIVHVVLPYADESEYQLKQICDSFITKEEIENGIVIGRDYFEIRDEEENEFIKKKNIKINQSILLIIILISEMICFIIMIIELFKVIIDNGG